MFLGVPLKRELRSEPIQNPSVVIKRGAVLCSADGTRKWTVLEDPTSNLGQHEARCLLEWVGTDEDPKEVTLCFSGIEMLGLSTAFTVEAS